MSHSCKCTCSGRILANNSFALDLRDSARIAQYTAPFAVATLVSATGRIALRGTAALDDHLDYGWISDETAPTEADVLNAEASGTLYAGTVGPQYITAPLDTSYGFGLELKGAVLAGRPPKLAFWYTGSLTGGSVVGTVHIDVEFSCSGVGRPARA
jgi:hypothetical protein